MGILQITEQTDLPLRCFVQEITVKSEATAKKLREKRPVSWFDVMNLEKSANRIFQTELVNKIGDLLVLKPTSKDIWKIISGYLSPGTDVTVIKRFFPLPNIRSYTFDFKGNMRDDCAIFINDGEHECGITLDKIEIDYGSTNK